ncbi:hypothetical protein GBA52_003838 [Prunus armeniaca]|nr:hypothetical protein GBA52_003838 [Prunus armeniaca]
MFFQIVCGPTCTVKSLTPAEWYLVFTVVASILSQLPNLNSIAWSIPAQGGVFPPHDRHMQGSNKSLMTCLLIRN